MTTDNKYWGWDDRMNTVFGRDTFEKEEQYVHWKLIRAANEHYKKEKPATQIDYIDFLAWLEDRYGIRVFMADGGYISGKYEVIDNDKYLMFQLAFTK